MTPEILRIVRAALEWRELETEILLTRVRYVGAASMDLLWQRMTEAQSRLRDAIDLLPPSQRKELK